MATKTIKKATFQQRVDQLKSNIGGFHDEALRTSEKMVEISLASGSKWQRLLAKVLDKGTDLLEKQQDIALNTLEEVKGQYLAGNKRVVKLLGLDQSKAKKAAKLQRERRSPSKNAPKASKANRMVTDLRTPLIQDDLKEIKGIGPKIESLLNGAGINSFDQLAATSIGDLRNILQSASPRYHALDPAPWKKQAKTAAAKRSNK